MARATSSLLAVFLLATAAAAPVAAFRSPTKGQLPPARGQSSQGADDGESSVLYDDSGAGFDWPSAHVIGGFTEAWAQLAVLLMFAIAVAMVSLLCCDLPADWSTKGGPPSLERAVRMLDQGGLLRMALASSPLPKMTAPDSRNISLVTDRMISFGDSQEGVMNAFRRTMTETLVSAGATAAASVNWAEALDTAQLLSQHEAGPPPGGERPHVGQQWDEHGVQRTPGRQGPGEEPPPQLLVGSPHAGGGGAPYVAQPRDERRAKEVEQGTDPPPVLDGGGAQAGPLGTWTEEVANRGLAGGRGVPICEGGGEILSFGTDENEYDMGVGFGPMGHSVSIGGRTAVGPPLVTEVAVSAPPAKISCGIEGQAAAAGLGASDDAEKGMAESASDIRRGGRVQELLHTSSRRRTAKPPPTLQAEAHASRVSVISTMSTSGVRIQDHWLVRDLTPPGSPTADGRKYAPAQRIRLDPGQLLVSEPPSPARTPSGHAVGIDLGTSDIRVALWVEGEEGDRRAEPLCAVPAFALFTGGRRLAGHLGKGASDGMLAGPPPFGPQREEAQEMIESCAWNMRRLIGRRMPDRNLWEGTERLPMEFVWDEFGTPFAQVLDDGEVKSLRVEQVLAAMLMEAKGTAEEAHPGLCIHEVTLTVPGSFNDQQRIATRTAAEIAGLKVTRLLNETTACAVAHVVGSPSADADPERARKVLLWTMGSGAFGCMVAQAGADGCLNVKSQSGDPCLGGQELDEILVQHCTNLFAHSPEEEEDLRGDPLAMARLRYHCEKAKIALSSLRTTQVDVPGLWAGRALSISVTREQFDNMCAAVFSELMLHVGVVVRNSGLGDGDIDEVVMVGGCAHIAKAQELLTQKFPKALHVVSAEATAGFASAAAGAAAVAAHLAGKRVPNLVGMQDVVPLTIGNANAQGRMCKIIPRNTPIPTTRTTTGITYFDDQINFVFRFSQGERVAAKGNFPLGTFVLDHVPPGARGRHKAEVVYHVDGDGILHLSAQLLTGTRDEVADVELFEQAVEVGADDIEEMFARGVEGADESEESLEQRFQALSFLSQSCNWIRAELEDQSARDMLNVDEFQLAKKDIRGHDAMVHRE